MSSIEYSKQSSAQADVAVAPSKGQPAIWGGIFEAEDPTDFLKTWELGKRDMPWRIWEWVSATSIDHVDKGKEELPDNPKLLERARLFGPDGDLSLRRDGNRFLWHFVGSRDVQLPAAFHREGGETNPNGEEERIFTAVDYWGYHPGAILAPSDKLSMLLWGQERCDQNGGRMGTWHEDRVSNVNRPIVYPEMSGASKTGRVQLLYREYLQGDVVEAVWWFNLERWEAQNG